MRRRSIASMLVVSLATMLGASLSIDQASASPAGNHDVRIAAPSTPRVNQRTGLPIGTLPTRGQLSHMARVNASTRLATSVQVNASPSYHLTWYGGPIVSNVEVQPVLWGTGTYIPEVEGPTTPNMGTFFQSITHQRYPWLLSEYNTASVGGYGQQIGAGSVLPSVTITPSSAGSPTSTSSGPTITDSQIRTELLNQIFNTTPSPLPPQTFDVHNLPNTTYVLYFPAGVNICQDSGLTQCSGIPPGTPGGQPVFCGYHSSFGVEDQTHTRIADVRYVVLPDTSSQLWLDGCSNYGATTPYTALQSVASHELAEVITDPESGEVTSNAPPLGWYDGTGASTDPGEIADICQRVDGPYSATAYTGSDGQTYFAQNLWSNRLGRCTISAPPVVRVTSAPALTTLAGSARLSYGAVDTDLPTGIKYDVAYKAAAWNGSWGPLTSIASHTTATTASLALRAATEYCIVVRARDSLGNVSPWSAPRCTEAPLDDTSLALKTSGWTRTKVSAAYRGTLTRTSRVGAKLAISGALTNRVGVVVETCSTCGKVQIYLGSTLWKTISTHAATRHYRVVLLPGGFSFRRTTVTLRAASGLVVIDGLGVLRAAPSF